jgi:hypothetical protein
MKTDRHIHPSDQCRHGALHAAIHMISDIIESFEKPLEKHLYQLSLKYLLVSFFINRDRQSSNGKSVLENLR